MTERDKWREATERYRERLHAKGLCIRCRRPLERERAHRLECAACAAENRLRTEERRERLRARGLCIDCGVRRPVTGQVRCRSCAIKAAEWQYSKHHR